MEGRPCLPSALLTLTGRFLADVISVEFWRVFAQNSCPTGSYTPEYHATNAEFEGYFERLHKPLIKRFTMCSCSQ